MKRLLHQTVWNWEFHHLVKTFICFRQVFDLYGSGCSAAGSVWLGDFFLKRMDQMDHIWAKVYQIRDAASQTPGLILEPVKVKRTP